MKTTSCTKYEFSPTLGVSSFETPPLIFIGGCHLLLGWFLQLLHLKPTLSSNERVPRRRSKVVGPMGHRPTMVRPHLPSPLAEALTCGPSYPWLMTRLVLSRFVLLVGPPIHVLLVCQHVIGRHLLPWIKRV
jgi:hypothetical protein